MRVFVLVGGVENEMKMRELLFDLVVIGVFHECVDLTLTTCHFHLRR